MAYAKSGGKLTLTSQDFAVTTAIDFGSTNCGYAFKVKGGDGIIVSTNWCGSNSSCKTPTCILFDDDLSTKAFGQEAVEEYWELDAEDREECLYFPHFTWQLHQRVVNEGLALDEDLELISTSGCKILAITVFAKSMDYLQRLWHDDVERMTGSRPNKADVITVVTAPIRYGNAAVKRFMRTAALQAGLIDTFDSTRLLIAGEDEAAVLCCRTVSIAQHSEKFGKFLAPATGDRFVVVDAGGRMVDVVAFQLISDSKLRQLHRISCDDVGGQTVNESFLNFMKELFSEETMDCFEVAEDMAYEQLIQDFEKAKRRYCGRKAMRLCLPYEFISFLSKEVLMQKITNYNESMGSKLELRAQTLTIPPECANNLFQPAIDAIIKYTREVYHHPNVQAVKMIMLVGGFADESSLLHTSVQEAFSQNVHVLVPHEPGFAVLKGAVLFVEKPLIVTEWIVPRSYGTSYAERYNQLKHGDEDSLNRHGNLRKFKSEEKYVINLFDSFVRMGDTVENGYTIEKTFSPMNHSSEVMVLKIYTSPRPDVRFVNEKSCEELCELKVPLKRTGEFRPCLVKFQFVNSEVQALVTDTTTGQSAQIKSFKM